MSFQTYVSVETQTEGAFQDIHPRVNIEHNVLEHELQAGLERMVSSFVIK